MVRFLARMWLSVKRAHLLRQFRRPRLHDVDGMFLVVLPGVHDPVAFRTGHFLARVIAEHGAPTGHAAHPRDAPLEALDMGTGSGIAAIAAARIGYRVTGVDINPTAVRCARANVVLNDLEDAVRMIQGDLFEPVDGRRFDLVIFNPPFFRGEPRDVSDAAWRSPDVLERFACGLGPALRPGGRALIVFSSDGDEAGLLRALRNHGFRTQSAARRNFVNEVVTVYAARRAGGPDLAST